MYYAKSENVHGGHITVKQHLEDVAELAKQFGKLIEMESEAELCGRLHDFGKYSEAFQRVLTGEQQNIDHAVSGAAYLAANKVAEKQYRAVCEAINGHHMGLTDYSELKELWRQLLRTPDRLEVPKSRKIASLCGQEEYVAASKQLRKDFPDMQLPDVKKHQFSDNIAHMLYTRMLFSCLVDADYSMSAEYDEPGYLERSSEKAMDAQSLSDRLSQYCDGIRRSSHADKKINQIRDELFDVCGQAGKQAPGLFTLTAPTGTGKTLALMNFALEHCKQHDKKRIIVVLPFLTLAEQNTKTYANIISEILVDHSQSDLSDEQRVFAERWSAPVIVTTSVKFFEALFKDKPTDCRKLHHVANSVILFDEAQSLPPQVTATTLKAVNVLCERYGCTMVFSSATQPYFDAIETVDWKPREIYPKYADLFAQLKRTQVEWRLAEDEKLSFEQLAAEMTEQTSVCTIVNKRAHAKELFSSLKETTEEDECFFLTTDVCAAHRRKMIEIINAHLADKKPCRVVATQCIEAGVDFDFDVMYRALAPLDSMIQAAGRCNRNGTNKNGGKVVIFVPEEEGRLYPSDWYQNAAGIVVRLNHEFALDIHNPEHIKKYYCELFRSYAVEKKALENALCARDYEETEKQYKLIEDNGFRVIVPYAGALDLYEEIEKQALQNGITPKLIKQAAAITVNTFCPDIDTYCERLNFQKKRGHYSEPSSFYLLRPQYREYYTTDMGLQLPENKNLNNWCF